MKKITCFAHRGACGHEPENTLRSIQKAIELGAEWIEIDVFPVEDELVVIHDETLDRCTNGTGNVLECSLDYLRTLDAGKGERIPYLREVFEIIGTSAKLNIELKWTGMAQRVVQLIDEYIRDHGWTYERILVSSLFHGEVQKVKWLQPKIPTAPVFSGPPPENYLQIAGELGASSLTMDADYIKKEMVKAAHHAGLKVFVFTVNTPEEIDRMKAIGVDGVFTNFPEIL